MSNGLEGCGLDAPNTIFLVKTQDVYEVQPLPIGAKHRARHRVYLSIGRAHEPLAEPGDEMVQRADRVRRLVFQANTTYHGALGHVEHKNMGARVDDINKSVVG